MKIFKNKNKQLNDKKNNNINTITARVTYEHSEKWEVTKVILPNGLNLYIKVCNNNEEDEDFLSGAATYITLEDEKNDNSTSLANINQEEFLGDKGLWDKQDAINEVSFTTQQGKTIAKDKRNFIVLSENK